MVNPAFASHIRQSAPSPSGSVGIVARAAGYPVHHSPIGAMFGRRRQAAEPRCLGSCRVRQVLRGIRRRSLQDNAKATEQRLGLITDSQRANIGSTALCADRSGESLCLRRVKVKGAGFSFARHQNCDGFAGHLSLHQRAGSPFRCIPYRANGPARQGGIL